MARLTYRFSHLGQWLDSVGDDLTNYLFCIALALGQAWWYRPTTSSTS